MWFHLFGCRSLIKNPRPGHLPSASSNCFAFTLKTQFYLLQLCNSTIHSCMFAEVISLLQFHPTDAS